MSSRVFEILQTKLLYRIVLVSRTKSENLKNVNLYEETRHDEFTIVTFDGLARYWIPLSPDIQVNGITFLLHLIETWMS